VSLPVPTRESLPGTRPAGAPDEAAASRHVREMFSRIAPRYDLLNHLLSLRFDVVWRKRLARRFRSLLARPDVRLLDLCCGTGDLALALFEEARRAGGSGTILGADFAHPMLLLAREKIRTQRAPVSLLEADALALPFPDGAFDLAAAAFGFRNLANYAAGLDELRRILRPGGSLAILEFAEPQGVLFGGLFRFYFHSVLPHIGGRISGNAQAYGYLPGSVARFPRATELARLMERAGFVDAKCERWTGGIVALHTARAPAKA
jgi:demethylmenaquinone methyltransferase/2-methoxy-6-polyprenyl-1,4-benzoquinol methylase